MKANYRRIVIGAAIVALALWLVPSRWAVAAEKEGEKENDEQVVKFSQLPRAVQETLKRESKGGKIGEIKGKEDRAERKGKLLAKGAEEEEEKEKAGGKEERGKIKGKEDRAERKGKLRAKGAEEEEEKEKAGGKEERGEIKGKEDRAERKGKLRAKGAEEEEEKEKAGDKEERGKIKGKEDRAERKGEKREGKKEEREKENEEKVTLAQLPSAVRATLKRESAGGTLGEITKETEEGKVIYEAEVTLDGEEYEVEIAGNGKLIKKALAEEEEEEGKAEKAERKGAKEK